MLAGRGGKSKSGVRIDVGVGESVVEDLDEKVELFDFRRKWFLDYLTERIERREFFFFPLADLDEVLNKDPLC